jgi:SAM-dependent methyltransferase
MKIMGKEADNNTKSWEQRSSEYQNTLKGVLFKRFPESLNRHIHKAQLEFILENVMGDSSRILDAGCGYGRISQEILKQFPKSELTGMDVSATYVDLYKKNTGRNAFQGNIGSFPEDSGSFDLIICVTVLMYLPQQELKPAIGEMLKHLNENGRIILIEPLKSGKIFSSGFGLLKFFPRADKGTAGNCFAARDLKNTIRNCGALPIQERRMPMTTFFIVPLFLLSKMFKQTECFYKFFITADKLIGRWRLPSLYVLLVIEKAHYK